MEESVIPSNYSWAAKVALDLGKATPLPVRPGNEAILEVPYRVSGRVFGVPGMAWTPPGPNCSERHSQGRRLPKTQVGEEGPWGAGAPGSNLTIQTWGQNRDCQGLKEALRIGRSPHLGSPAQENHK
jgi:hypothetical protein